MNGPEWFQLLLRWTLLLPPIAVSASAVPLSIYAFVADIWGGSSKILTALLLPAVVSLSVGIACFLARLLARQTRDIQRLSRKRRDACLRCGYCLRDNISGICPECGAAWRTEAPRAY
jgi:uncharacterized paraquat-inducible protein A